MISIDDIVLHFLLSQVHLTLLKSLFNQGSCYQESTVNTSTPWLSLQLQITTEIHNSAAVDI